jgi:hypothetical protein
MQFRLQLGGFTLLVSIQAKNTMAMYMELILLVINKFFSHALLKFWFHDMNIYMSCYFLGIDSADILIKCAKKKMCKYNVKGKHD